MTKPISALALFTLWFAPLCHAQNPASSGEWHSCNSPVTASLRGISVIDGTSMWASGAQGTVIRTTNAGTSFEIISVPNSSDAEFRDIQALDDKRIVLMTSGQPARFWLSQDNGATWAKTFESSAPDAFFNSMHFSDSRNGMAFSDPVGGRLLIVTTHNGGQTWSPLAEENQPVTGSDEHGYAASGSCLALDRRGHVWIGLGGTGPNDKTGLARVLISQDAGMSWNSSVTTIPGTASSGVFSLVMLEGQKGIAIGGDYMSPDKNKAVISLTKDGGKTWLTPKSHGLRGYRSSIAAVGGPGALLLICCGPTGCDWSNDGGHTWNALSDTGYHALGVSRDQKNIWAVGSDGRIARLTFLNKPR